jgi:KUP system potassium uptake protein
MVALVAILVWRLPTYVVLPIWLVFAALDGAFLSSVFEKVPDGAWFTLMLAFILASIFTLWRFGKETQWRAESKDLLAPFSLLDPGQSSALGGSSSTALKPAFGGLTISTVPGLGIFFDKAGDPRSLPPCFAEFVKKFAARPAIVIFFHMRPLPKPSIPLNERYIVTRMAGLAGCYNVTLRHGYADDVLHPDMARDLVRQIELAISRVQSANSSDSEAELQNLQSAYSSQMVYILGKEVMKIQAPGRRVSLWRYIRHSLLWVFLWIRENSRAKLADLNIDADKLIEVGFVKEI